MKHYEFPSQFRAVYDRAVTLYGGGQRGVGTFFTPDETRFLAANGLTAQNLHDYAEDHHGYDGEPGPHHALAIELVRRDYFLNAQGGRASTVVIGAAQLPAKSATVRGIAWLPRLIPKAHAKLHGELPPTLMYGCGGDRGFFREHNILPAEFLTLVWRHENQPDAIADWVVRRSRS